jgi:outer membrane biosynthesis protein TonB
MLFFVHRDGSVSGLQFVRRSGSFAFDLEAQGAVEAAARAGGFGTLPPGYGPDVLPVSFFFSPRTMR